jgi:hypothetical protein
MQLSPHERMSLAMHVNRGSYAFLLGSGVSKSAGIPTGWEIVLDMIRKLAKLQGLEQVEDPEQWFLDTYKSRPTFGNILDLLQLKEEERRKILVPYVEGNGKDKGESPSPTTAHHAVANLVKGGSVRLILTTNIDRLMEKALHEASVDFDLLSSDASFEGAPPIHEPQCLLAKLHGDYRETGVRLTASELERYPAPIRRFLRKVLPDFGLVICGWSGEWDTALREALLRTRVRRFTSFWLSLIPTETSELAQRIIDANQAVIVPIEGADESLPKLCADLKVLDTTSRSHPVAVEAVVQNVRNLASSEHSFPDLETILHEESEMLHDALVEENARWENAKSLTSDAFHDRLHRYEELTERMAQVISAGSFYCSEQSALLLKRSIERIGAFPESRSSDRLSSLQKYPALLLVYAGAIAALAAERFSNLYAVLLRPEWWCEEEQCQVMAIEKLNAKEVFVVENRNLLPCDKDYRDWLRPSFYLSDNVLRPILKRYEPNQHKYQNQFDIFEYVQSLVHSDVLEPRFPLVGRFATYLDYFTKGDLPSHLTSPIGRFFNREVQRKKGSALLEAGFFRGKFDRLASVAHKQRVEIADFIRNKGLF